MGPSKKPICTKVLASWLMCRYVAVIFSCYVRSSWCCLFYEELQFLLWQNSPTTWCCHLRPSLFVWCPQVKWLHPFSPKCNTGHFGQTALLEFQQSTGHVSSNKSLCCGAFYKLQYGFFLCFFRSNSFFLAKQPFMPMSAKDSFHCAWWHFFTSFTSIFTRSSVSVPWLTHSNLRHVACLLPQIWFLDIPIMIILAYNYLNRRTWHRQASGSIFQPKKNQTCGASQFSPWSFGRFLSFSHLFKQGSRVFEVWPWDTSPGVSSTNSHDVS